MLRELWLQAGSLGQLFQSLIAEAQLLAISKWPGDMKSGGKAFEPEWLCAFAGRAAKAMLSINLLKAV